jgi:Predicted periplasmic ligand-binding sensor domain
MTFSVNWKLSDWPVKRKLRLSYAVLILLILLIVGLFFGLQASEASARYWTDHTYKVLLSLDQLERASHEQRASVRSYALSGDSIYRKRLAVALRRFDSMLAELRAQVGDNPLQVTRVDRLAALQGDWRRLLRNHEGSAGRPQDYAALITGHTALDLMARIGQVQRADEGDRAAVAGGTQRRTRAEGEPRALDRAGGAPGGPVAQSSGVALCRESGGGSTDGDQRSHAPACRWRSPDRHAVCRSARRDRRSGAGAAGLSCCCA